MQKRTKIITASIVAGVLVLGATAAIAGPIIYRDLIVGPAADAPTVTVTPNPEAGTGDAEASDPTGEWTVADGSFAGYRVDEVLNGTDVTVVGRTDQVTGEITVDGLTLTDAAFEVDVASIATDSANRDDYFRTSAMNAAEHPTANFVLTEPVTVDEAPAVGEVQTVQATGDLTLAGVTQSVTVDLQAVLNGDTGQVAGSIPITFADFGVEAPNLGFVSVEPDGFVELSLELERA
ncbi:polyisoprenoid-binding protein YceI [Agromyces terreus]|uniref:Polyisoprenoid-binding protein YceI n=1 Tax=Agromyces terreus TaxID=424795 RepID=A0A9X2GXL6_9MICO|nr:YceI family protein [Agromyces terreus]MCP2370492.1 polyisoprenoid-binding protein YceI [Agromyces terreus]